jgi:hypothetical protein
MKNYATRKVKWLENFGWEAQWFKIITQVEIASVAAREL